MEVGLDDYALTGDDHGDGGELNIDTESAEVEALLSNDPPTVQGASTTMSSSQPLSEEPRVPQLAGTS